MRLPEEPDLPPRINILPMIDVIFAILVFFLVSSLYLTRSEGLSVNLPRAKTAQLQKSQPITVSLDSQGKLTINSQPAQLEELKAQIEEMLKNESSTTVIVNADKTVEHGQVVDVIDQLRQIPQVQLAIAAKKKQ
ncbi:biopolymer transporter ExbD [Pleurocapsa sp. PCC 7319]|uniref:ExbD/TolR family protein n=1 Tax=Pleurocapsa sp. PCC 7319 TaxID=118161 RepID=UPI00034B39F2|nr:biopolymer transporter ExbD [Pleurocapsa sp. PCC 7319]